MEINSLLDLKNALLQFSDDLLAQHEAVVQGDEEFMTIAHVEAAEEDYYVRKDDTEDFGFLSELQEREGFNIDDYEKTGSQGDPMIIAAI